MYVLKREGEGHRVRKGFSGKRQSRCKGLGGARYVGGRVCWWPTGPEARGKSGAGREGARTIC